MQQRFRSIRTSVQCGQGFKVLLIAISVPVVIARNPNLLWTENQKTDLNLCWACLLFITIHSVPFLFSALGAAYGTAKSGTGIAAMSVMRPELIMKSIIPVVMAGIIAIYGLVVAALIANSIDAEYDLFK